MDDTTASTTASTSITNLMGLLNLIGQDTGGLWLAISTFCYIGSFVFLYMGIRYMMITGNPKSRGSYGIMPTAWFWNFATGFVLFAFPSFLSTVAATFGTTATDTTALSYQNLLSGNGPALGTCTLSGITPLLQVVGVLAVIYGVLQFRNLGTYGRHSTSGYGPWHCVWKIVAGMALIHQQEILTYLYTNSGITISTVLC